MAESIFPTHSSDVQNAADFYQRAAQALLLAYQRNKEATRHHARGAFRAAHYHARMSAEHATDAEIQLEKALALSKILSDQDAIQLNSQEPYGQSKH